MAIMIPDSCPARATVGEKRTYGLLQDLLPDDFTVWYEPVVQGRYPDFTLLAGSFGLLVLEAKGWYPKQLIKVTDQDVELLRTADGREHVERHKNPIRQVREYLFGLMDELGRPEYAILRNADGDHRGKLCFPCGYGVLFTNITRAHLDEAGLSAVFPPERVLCRDDLAALEGGGDREAIRRLKRLFPAYFPFDPLTEDQVRTVKGVIHKEVVVRARPATRASVPPGKALPEGAVALEVLDAQQEQVARSLNEGHHVFFGVAGSGKSVLLLARARLVARQDPSRRVLVLCYNRALAAHLADKFSGDPAARNVEVRHFLSWAARRTGLRKRDDEPFDGYERRVVDTMLRCPDVWPEADKYDAILIDEGHDFEPDWFRCAVGQLKGGPAGDLMIAVDGRRASTAATARSPGSRSGSGGGADQAAVAQLPQHQADPGVRLAGGPVDRAGRPGLRGARAGPADEGVAAGADAGLPGLRHGRRGARPDRPAGGRVQGQGAWPSGTSPCSTRAGSGIGSTRCAGPCGKSPRCAGSPTRPTRTGACGRWGGRGCGC